MPSFNDLPLDSNIKKAIDACGYTSPTPVQEKAIPAILEGRDVVASAQTGSGKTAAFVLPALNYLSQQKPIKKPRVLILTPTRELAAQINKAAAIYGKFLNFNIVSILGGMSYHHQIRDLQRGADIIVATPGRLLDHLENKRVDLSNVEFLVLDEADRMVDMGFIEDVEAIASVTPESRQTLFFSATIDSSINKIVSRLLKNPVRIDLSQQQTSAPNIKQTLYKAKNMHHKVQMLKHFLNDENIFKAIIFTATKQLCDKLANELRGDGFAAAPLHGDLRQNQRNRTVDGLRRGKIQFLIATDVAARGLDISDITHVINFDLPRFSEDYVHRIGRTGRAGKSGEAISFFTSPELKQVQKIERYIGKRLPIQPFATDAEIPSTNTRSDAEQFSPDNMFEPERHRRQGRDGGGYRGRSSGGGDRRRFDDKPRRSFDGDKPKRFDDRDDKPRKRFNDDDSRPAKRFDREDRPAKRFDRDDRPAKRFDRDDKPAKRFDRDDKPAKRFDRDDRPAKRFDRDDRPAKRFDRDDRPAKRFDRDDRPAKRFDRDDRPAKRFDRDDRPAKRFDRDDRPAKRFDRDDRPAKRFDRDDRPAKRFDRDDRPAKRFDRDDRPAKGRGDKPFGDKRSSGNRNDYFDKPRKRSDSQGKVKSDSVFERPQYTFEQSEENPRVRYKKKVEGAAPRKDRSSSSFKGKSASDRKPSDRKPSGKNTKKPFKRKDK